MRQTSVILLLALLLGLLGCRQKNVDPQLPPETMTGQDTFGFLVNGKVWVPGRKALPFRSYLTMSYEPGYYKGTLAIQANISNYEKSMSLTKTGVNQLGTYHFMGDSTSGVA